MPWSGLQNPKSSKASGDTNSEQDIYIPAIYVISCDPWLEPVNTNNSLYFTCFKKLYFTSEKKIFHSRFTLRAQYVLYTSNWKAVGASIDAEGAVEVSYDAREASNDAGDTVKAKMMLDVQ